MGDLVATDERLIWKTPLKRLEILAGNYEQYVEQLIQNQLKQENLKIEAGLPPQFIMTEDDMELGNKKIRDWAMDVISERLEEEFARFIEFYMHEWINSDLLEPTFGIDGPVQQSTHWIETITKFEKRLVSAI